MKNTANTVTAETERNAKVAARIAKAISSGMKVEEAVDAVLGAGTYEKLAGEIYEALRNGGAK